MALIELRFGIQGILTIGYPCRLFARRVAWLQKKKTGEESFSGMPVGYSPERIREINELAVV